MKMLASTLCPMCGASFFRGNADIINEYGKSSIVSHRPESFFCVFCHIKLETFFDNAFSPKEQIQDAINRAKKSYGDDLFEKIILMQELEPKDDTDVLHFIDWYLLAAEMQNGLVIFTGNELVSTGEFPTYHLM